MKRITVKIGSNVLARADGTLDVTRMSALVDQVVALNRRGVQVVVVSSGAVASGRSELSVPADSLDAVSARQLFSAVGQAKLMNRYFDFFRGNGSACGQVLTTKEFFATRSHYDNQKRCMEVMLANGVVPVVNENDTISVTELMFTDNDELSGLVARMTESDMLVILSNVAGIFDGDPAAPGSRVIREIRPDDADLSVCVTRGKSQFGRGGMLTKCGIARRVAAEGIPVVIADGKAENILLRLLDDPAGTLCTRFVPAPKPPRGADAPACREIVVSDAALAELRTGRPRSLRSDDVVRCCGEFFRDELVRVLNADGAVIGYGKALCSGAELLSLLENAPAEAREIIHYDYLFLD